MPKTVATVLSDLDEQIIGAWADLLDARADATRSPNADSIRTEEYAELRLNRLLERRHAAKS